MAMISLWLNMDEKSIISALEEAGEKLDSAAGEIVLDFVSVAKIDAAALRAIERVANKAAEKTVKIVLHGVNVDVYKVLKLTKLAPHFSFVSLTGDRERAERENRHAKRATK